MTPVAMAPAAAIDWQCPAEGLDSALRMAIEEVAAHYAAATGRRLVISSGRRSLRRQAELMAAMTPEQLRLLYCRHGEPDYIPPILAALTVGPESRVVERVHAILKQRLDGYVSAHLYGGAVDIALAEADLPVLVRLLESHGFEVLDETAAGIPCLHASYASSRRSVVRE